MSDRYGSKQFSLIGDKHLRKPNEIVFLQMASFYLIVLKPSSIRDYGKLLVIFAAITPHSTNCLFLPSFSAPYYYLFEVEPKFRNKASADHFQTR